MTYFVLLSHMLALFMTSLIQIAGHKMAARAVFCCYCCLFCYCFVVVCLVGFPLGF